MFDLPSLLEAFIAAPLRQKRVAHIRSVDICGFSPNSTLPTNDTSDGPSTTTLRLTLHSAAGILYESHSIDWSVNPSWHNINLSQSPVDSMNSDEALQASEVTVRMWESGVMAAEWNVDLACLCYLGLEV